MSKLGHLSLVKVLEEKNGKNEHVFQWPQSRSQSQFRLEKTKLPLRNSRDNIIVLITACNCEYAQGTCVRTRSPAFNARLFGIVLLITTVEVHCTVQYMHAQILS